ncbi:hypothetical protein [Streptomyces griseorubiginosus]|uniref:Peptidase inhibitor family I36 n=1 Tax=Streptomyces griseorubiginosus TaxID=67304 RepID=A0AAI8L1P9_9ACTN|nr:hypothetical protein [Streptomyces griseorubiginosus]AYC40020.1 hypothetical protein DWG14_04266 [Streptomyces griseorubiginosus]
MKRRITAAVVSAAAAFVALLPTNAFAGAYSDCPSGGPCVEIYYNSYWGGSHTAFTSSVSNFASYTFLASGAGKGTSVKNNGASARLLDYPDGGSSNAAIFFNSGYGGACDFFYGHQEGSFTAAWRLGPTYNNNASFYFTKGGPPSGSNCATWR